MKVTILGCGTSGGVPQIGGNWGQCNPSDPRNRRRRCSILIEAGETKILVDTSPDMREQLISAGTGALSAVLWTHAHADHLNGIDDLRGVNRVIKKPIDGYADQSTIARISKAYEYALEYVPEPPFYKPAIVLHEITGPFSVGDFEIVPFQQDHEVCATLGYRFGPIAYSTDVVRLNETAFELLAGVELWIVDALRVAPHPTHSHLEQTLAWIARVKPRQAYLTHLDETMDYVTLANMLPPGVAPAYDMLVLEI